MRFQPEVMRFVGQVPAEHLYDSLSKSVAFLARPEIDGENLRRTCSRLASYGNHQAGGAVGLGREPTVRDIRSGPTPRRRRWAERPGSQTNMQRRICEIEDDGMTDGVGETDRPTRTHGDLLLRNAAFRGDVSPVRGRKLFLPEELLGS